MTEDPLRDSEPAGEVARRAPGRDAPARALPGPGPGDPDARAGGGGRPGADAEGPRRPDEPEPSDPLAAQARPGDRTAGGHVFGHPDRPGTRRPALVALGVAAAILLVGVVVAWQLFGSVVGGLFESKDYDGPGTGSVSVVVEPGDSGRAIGESLQRAGVIKTVTAFESALQERSGDEIQPGRYSLKAGMSAADALASMRQGRDVLRVTVPEGLWKSEVYALLAQASGRSVADYEDVERRAATQPALLRLPEAANGNPEGYLFPATYEFDPRSTPQRQLHEMVGQATAQLRRLGVPPAQMERTVTIASLVEAEAKLPADRPKVARVIENRLADGMRLQLDSTVNYGIQRKRITTTDTARAARNGYNTYAAAGLPVAPIGSPGTASIQAAQNPAPGPWMFFVTVDPETGHTLFATTEQEHFANVAKFQQWCQARPGTC